VEEATNKDRPSSSSWGQLEANFEGPKADEANAFLGRNCDVFLHGDIIHVGGFVNIEDAHGWIRKSPTHTCYDVVYFFIVETS
jgi:hypothetical protein